MLCVFSKKLGRNFLTYVRFICVKKRSKFFRTNKSSNDPHYIIKLKCIQLKSLYLMRYYWSNDCRFLRQWFRFSLVAALGAVAFSWGYVDTPVSYFNTESTAYWAMKMMLRLRQTDWGVLVLKCWSMYIFSFAPQHRSTRENFSGCIASYLSARRNRSRSPAK